MALIINKIRNRQSSKSMIKLDTINTTELNKVLDNLAEDFIEEYLVLAAMDAVDNAPVDTGVLKGSIGIAPSLAELPESGIEDPDGRAAEAKIGIAAKKYNEEDNLIIGASAYYASHVEFGTSNSVAQPFLRPAIAKHAHNANISSNTIKPRKN